MGTEERNPGASLPAGVVTFLMTDVVGSTPLWERAPLVMDATLQRHDALVEQTVNLHGGHLLLHRGEGDSTFSVFESATAAVAAANEIQRRLGDEQWHESTPIAVRMGIHSGEVVIRNHDYYGRTVNRAARVRGLADGGQIYVTGAVAGLVNDDVPDGTELRFVRVEVLRGIDHPEEIYELVDPARPIPVAPADVVASDRPFPEAIVADTPDVFAGRAELLVQLDAIRAASVGALNVVLLAGEPGSGKSSLAAVAATRAHADGWLVVAAASDEGARVPYQAVREVLTQCVDAAPRWLLGEHASEHGGEVGRLTPRLAIRLGALGLSDPIEIDTTRRLLAEAVIDLLRRMTEIWPIVMVLDDLQWADRSTLQMLEAIVAAQVPGLLVLGTYRAGHADRGEFAGWLERILRRSGVSNIEVQGLGEDEMFEFLEGVAGHELGDAGRGIAALLAVETQGNALFMIEILRHMVESGLLATGADGHWHLQADLERIPPSHSLHAVLHERFGRLGPERARVLEAASVLGREFDTAVLATMLTLTELAVLDHLDAAVASSLVREVSIGRFEFSHALVQHNLYDNIRPTRRGLMHREAALAIEAAAGDGAPAATLADHWLATDRDDRVHVAKWSRLAGEQAMTSLAPEDAEVWFQRALNALDDPGERLAVMIELGGAQRWADGRSFRGTLLTAAALAEQLDDDAAYVRAALANHRGGASRAGAIDEERMAVFEHALELVGDGDSSERALLVATIAMEGSQGSDIDRSIELADEALAIARRVGDEFTLFLVLLRITEATRIPATLDRRLAASRELFDIAERLGDPVQLGFAAVRDLRTKFEAAHFDDMDRGFRVLEAFGHLDPFVQHNHRTLQAVRAQVAGDLSGALELAEQARELGESEVDAGAVYVSTVSMVRWDLGTLDTMVPLMERIRRDFPGVTGFRPLVALAYAAAGRDDDAREILDEGTSNRFADHPLNPLWGATMSLYASLCIEVGDRRAAEMLYDILEPLRGRACTSVVSYSGLITEKLAALAVVAGDLSRAESDAREALEQSIGMGVPVSTVRSTLTLARRAAVLGDDAALLEHARAAQAGAERLGMMRVARQAAGLVAATTVDEAAR